jgi:transcription elongation factor Elf1
MKIMLSATFEGKCSLCGKKAIVFTIGDEDTKRAVTLCKECADKLEYMKTSEVIEKFGKENKTAFKKGIRIEKKKEAG